MSDILHIIYIYIYIYIYIHIIVMEFGRKGVMG